jgi:hypothetical protein
MAYKRTAMLELARERPALIPASPPSPIVLRPSSDDDVPAMLDIYRHHIGYGVGNLGAFEPTPPGDRRRGRPS